MEIDAGWAVASTPAGRFATPEQLVGNDLEWLPATVPGTVAAAIDHEGRDLDADDWWFRCRFSIDGLTGDGDLLLELDGVATVCDVFLNGEEILRSSSMWQPHSVDIGAIANEVAENELVIACRALRPLLAVSRRPRARWRTRVVNDNNLRWYRTMIFGRSPGFAAAPAAVGPWRPVRVLRRRHDAPGPFSIRARLEGDAGRVTVSAASGSGPEPGWTISIDGRRQDAAVGADGRAIAEVVLEDVRRWWPHTHGEPHLYEVGIEFDGEPVATHRVGFRELHTPADISRDGLALELNGVPIHLRGAVWTPIDLVGLTPDPEQMRRILTRVQDCGMNMLRVVGTAHYESPQFHDLCDELGILVWQDLMFATLDYPLDDDGFRAEAESEARRVVASLAHRPSVVCICGNSEVEQQPAMTGLDPTLGRHPFWEQTLPEIVREEGSDAACVRSTPSGGALPFHPDQGVTHYFGVSGYFRGPADVRRSEVLFATECLAFANVPDEVEVPVHHPRWKEGVIRDAGTGWDIGAGWDFDDVRDHYLAHMFDVDPVQLRRSDHARYLELSRAVSGEVMAEAMNEWRRAESPCRGALVLWLTDMRAGAGFGVLDVAGAPKVCYHHLRRALAPVAVWMTDEGLSGLALHIANDRSTGMSTRLRLTLYREDVEVAGAEQPVTLAPHSTVRLSGEAMLGRFYDIAWAYRFGPPVADVVVATLQDDDARALPVSQAFWFPAARPVQPRSAAALGLRAAAVVDGAGARIEIHSDSLAYGVRVRAAGFEPSDDAFCVEPGGTRVVTLVAVAEDATFASATVTALNLSAPVIAVRGQ